MIEFKDGRIDNRRVLFTKSDNMGTEIAIVANYDGTFEEVYFSHYYSIGGWDDPIVGETYVTSYSIDKNPDDMDNYYNYLFNKRIKGQTGMFAVPGMTVEIVKGRKYPLGTKLLVDSTYTYVVRGTYGHGDVPYIKGHTEDGKEIKVSALNTKIIDYNGNTHLLSGWTL